MTRKIDPLLQQELDASGLNWEIVNGGKHKQIRVEGKMVTLLGYDGQVCGNNRALWNTRAQIRRGIKAIVSANPELASKLQTCPQEPQSKEDDMTNEELTQRLFKLEKNYDLLASSFKQLAEQAKDTALELEEVKRVVLEMPTPTRTLPVSPGPADTPTGLLTTRGTPRIRVPYGENEALLSREIGDLTVAGARTIKLGDANEAIRLRSAVSQFGRRTDRQFTTTLVGGDLMVVRVA